MKKILTIRADTNDADYVTEETDITDFSEESIERIHRVVAAIKEMTKEVKYGHNWPTSEFNNGSPSELYSELPDDDVEFFDELVPYGEYGVHTIESVTIRVVTEETELL